MSARFNAESFFARVQKTDTCWIWTGARHPSGEENLRRYWAAYTHCKNGHEFNEANTYNRPTGGRSCRACGRDRVRQYLARKAAKAV